MNDKEKKQWIIRYIKKNKIDDILAEKYKNGKQNVLKKYTNELQSICSIISVLVIGIASLAISVQNNSLVNKQTQIMRYEQKPIIDIIKDSEDDYTDKLSVVNNGTDAINYNIEIITYLDVLCNENNMGSTPIRLYFMNAVDNLELRNTDEIAGITLYKEAYPPITSLKKDLREIISNYTDLYWDSSFTYLIKVTSTDILNEDNTDYFICNRQGMKRVGDNYGDNIVDEFTCMIDNHDGIQTSKESFFDLEKVNAELVFKYTLKKIRENNLYQVDFLTNEKYLYGKYEPQKK